MTSNALRVTTLETDLADNTSRIELLESNISYDRTVTVEGVEQTVNGNVYTLSQVVDDHASNISTLETDLTDNASRISTLETDVTSNTARLELLESNISYDRTVTVDGVEETVNGNVYTLSQVVDDHESRIADIEDDYVTSSQLTAATASSAVASTGTSSLISTASTFFTKLLGRLRLSVIGSRNWVIPTMSTRTLPYKTSSINRVTGRRIPRLVVATRPSKVTPNKNRLIKLPKK